MTEIRGSGGGGSKGGGNQHTPTEADDSLQSVQYAKVLDLLCEGPIQGLDDGHKSIYLDGTPVLDSSGNANFEGYSIVTRTGTQDQTYVSDLASNENEVAVGVDITNSTPVVRTITNSAIDRVRVTLQIPTLRLIKDNGDIVGNTVDIKIQVQYNGGGYNDVKEDTISGKASSSYKRDYLIDLTGSKPVDIKLIRVSADESSTKKSSTTTWSSYTEIIDEKLRYPNSALAFLRFDSRQFNSIPKRKYLIRGTKVRIPSNATVDTTNHLGRLTYSGIWNGSFQSATWCADPAWCLYDLLTDGRYGVNLPESTLDKWDFYEISKYCNELVPDKKGGNEPRMLCNLLINSRDEVYNVIQQMTSLFRGISYYGAGSIVMVQDAPKDSQYILGNSNVVDGAFEYSGSSQKARHTTCAVAWQSYDSLGEVQFEYVEDPDAIAKYGIIEKQVKALGCYSQGQAHRMGRWLLKSEQLLTQTCNFSVGIDSGLVLRPGMVIDIADELRAGVRRSGRIKGGGSNYVIADSSQGITNVSDIMTKSPQLSILLSTGLVETKTVSNILGPTIYINGTFSETPASPRVWLLNTSDPASQQYRVISVSENSEKTALSVACLEYNSSIYNSVDSGDTIVLRDITSLSASPNAISNLIADPTTGFLYSDGQSVFVGCSLSWDHDRKNVTEYRVQYKIDNDNWESLVTSTPSVTLRNLRAGTLSVQVQAYNFLGKGSKITTGTFAIAGKTAAPADPQNFKLTPNSSTQGRLTWDLCPDLDVVIGGWVRVKHSPDTSNVTWANSVLIHDDLPGSSKETYCDMKDGTYLIKFVDSGQRESVNPALVEVVRPNIEDVAAHNCVADHPNFTGTKTQLAVDSGTNELRLAADGGTSGGNATFHTSGTYYLSSNSYRDFGDVFTARLITKIKVRSYYPYTTYVDSLGTNYNANATPSTTGWDAIKSVDGDVPEDAKVETFVRTTSVGSPAESDWSDWMLFNNCDINCRRYQVKAVFSTNSNLEQIAIQQFEVCAYVPQVTKSGTGTTSANNAVSLTFANRFMTTPSIGINFSATSTGDYYTLHAVATNGFSFSVYNASGTRIAKTVHWQALGYGKES